MGECASTSADLAEFEEWAAIFLNPKLLTPTVKANLKTHLVPLTLDVKKAKKFLKNEEYFKLGVEVGTMLVILTTPEAALDETFWQQTDQKNFLQ